MQTNHRLLVGVSSRCFSEYFTRNWLLNILHKNAGTTYSNGLFSDANAHAERDKGQKNLLEMTGNCNCKYFGARFRLIWDVVVLINSKLLKIKRNLLYIRNQSVQRCNHSPTIIITNQLMMYKTKLAVSSGIRTKHSTQLSTM